MDGAQPVAAVRPLRLALAAAALVGAVLMLAAIFGSTRASAADAASGGATGAPPAAAGSPGSAAGGASTELGGEVTATARSIAAFPAGASSAVSGAAAAVAARLGALSPVAQDLTGPVTGLLGGVATGASQVTTPVLTAAGGAVAGIVDDLPVLGSAESATGAPGGSPVGADPGGVSEPNGTAHGQAVIVGTGALAVDQALSCAVPAGLATTHAAAFIASSAVLTMTSAPTAPTGPAAPFPPGQLPLCIAASLGGASVAPGSSSGAPPLAVTSDSATLPSRAATSVFAASGDRIPISPAYERDTTPE